MVKVLISTSWCGSLSIRSSPLRVQRQRLLYSHVESPTQLGYHEKESSLAPSSAMLNTPRPSRVDGGCQDEGKRHANFGVEVSNSFVEAEHCFEVNFFQLLVYHFFDFSLGGGGGGPPLTVLCHRR